MSSEGQKNMFGARLVTLLVKPVNISLRKGKTWGDAVSDAEGADTLWL